MSGDDESERGARQARIINARIEKGSHEPDRQGYIWKGPGPEIVLPYFHIKPSPDGDHSSIASPSAASSPRQAGFVRIEPGTMLFGPRAAEGTESLTTLSEEHDTCDTAAEVKGILKGLDEEAEAERIAERRNQQVVRENYDLDLNPDSEVERELSNVDQQNEGHSAPRQEGHPEVYDMQLGDLHLESDDKAAVTRAKAKALRQRVKQLKETVEPAPEAAPQGALKAAPKAHPWHKAHDAAETISSDDTEEYTEEEEEGTAATRMQPQDGSKTAPTAARNEAP